jgi:hypothetical protein
MLIVLLQAHQASSNSGINPTLFLIFAILACVLGAQFVWSSLRRQALQELARRRGLEWRIGELPSGFPEELLDNLGGWSTFGGWSKTYDVVTGYEGDDQLLAFDIRVGRGRNSYRQTVVAVRSGSPRGVPIWGGRDIFRQQDGWRVLIPKKSFFAMSGVLSVNSIEESWSALR